MRDRTRENDIGSEWFHIAIAMKPPLGHLFEAVHHMKQTCLRCKRRCPPFDPRLQVVLLLLYRSVALISTLLSIVVAAHHRILHARRSESSSEKVF